MTAEHRPIGPVVVEIYRARRRGVGPQEYRWRAVARNYRKVATSGEGYRNLQDCKDAIALVFEHKWEVTAT